MIVEVYKINNSIEKINIDFEKLLLLNKNNNLTNFIDYEEKIDDNLLLNNLKIKYFKYGIINSEFIINKDSNNYFYRTTINKEKKNNLENKFICYNNLIKLVNNYLDISNNFLNLISKYNVKLNHLNNKIIEYQNNLRLNNSKIYIFIFKKVNQIIEIINTINFLLYNDFNYFYLQCLKFKYYTLIDEENVEIIFDNYINLQNYKKLLKLNFLITYNNVKYEFKIEKGIFNIDMLINLIEDNFSNNFDNLNISFNNI